MGCGDRDALKPALAQGHSSTNTSSCWGLLPTLTCPDTRGPILPASLSSQCPLGRGGQSRTRSQEGRELLPWSPQGSSCADTSLGSSEVSWRKWVLPCLQAPPSTVPPTMHTPTSWSVRSTPIPTVETFLFSCQKLKLPPGMHRVPQLPWQRPAAALGSGLALHQRLEFGNMEAPRWPPPSPVLPPLAGPLALACREPQHMVALKRWRDGRTRFLHGHPSRVHNGLLVRSRFSFCLM